MIKYIITIIIGMSIGAVSTSHASDIESPYTKPGMTLASHHKSPDPWPTPNMLALNLPSDAPLSHRHPPLNARTSAEQPINRHLDAAMNDPQRAPINVDATIMALQLNVDDETALKIKVHSGYYFSVSKRW